MENWITFSHESLFFHIYVHLFLQSGKTGSPFKEFQIYESCLILLGSQDPLLCADVREDGLEQ